LAEARRADPERRRADERAWFDSAFRDAERLPSCFSARLAARDRFADGRRRELPARLADCALRFVDAFAPAGGFPSSTPDRRAFDRPIAMACFVDRAPCLPSRM
jgi:hypothetical protein